MFGHFHETFALTGSMTFTRVIRGFAVIVALALINAITFNFPFAGLYCRYRCASK